jgi:predicted PurR-regulated permease PerM
MSFLGIKYTVLMSFWAFVTNFIPIVGVIFEFVPLALVGLSSGVESMVWLLVLMSVIHGSAFIFFLFVMRGYSKINPFFIILAILIFGQIFNVLGILIAVPLCLIIKLFWTNFIKPYFERG